MECPICKKVFNNSKLSSLGKHVHNQHREYSKQSFYDTFLRINNSEGICKICSKQTKFRGFVGYASFCSISCRSLDTDVRTKLSNFASGKKQSAETIAKRIANTDQTIKESNRIKSMKDRYGENVTNPSQTPGFQEKYKETSLRNWGTEYPTQNSAVFANREQYKKRKFIINSYEFTIQGYEDTFLEQLNVLFPDIHYKDLLEERNKTLFRENGSVHFPDFYSKKHNHMFEVKSDWTFSQRSEDVLLKKQEAENQGYKYSIIVWKRRTSKPYII